MIDRFKIQELTDLPIEGVAERLGLRVVQHKCLCPFHDDKHPSLMFDRRRNRYRCFVCGAHGRTIDLVMGVERKSFVEACEWLSGGSKVEGLGSRDGALGKVSRPEGPQVEKSFDVSRLVPLVEHPFLTEEAQHFLFTERKLDRRVVEWCGISSTHTHLLIPYFGQDGRLRSVQWRYLGKDPNEPRFRFPRGGQCHIYNLQILQLLKPQEPLYITEGCSDCWAMLSAGHKAIAIPSATLLKPEDWQLLSSLHDERSTTFHMYPDQDAPGEHLFLELRKRLGEAIERHQLPDGCKDFGEMWKKCRV